MFRFIKENKGTLAIKKVIPLILIVAVAAAALGIAANRLFFNNNNGKKATVEVTVEDVPQDGTEVAAIVEIPPEQVPLGNVTNKTNNTLTVKGTCESVNIGGADNKITLDKIDSQLHVVGFNNTITYKNGDPKVDNVGTNNTINKG